MNTGLNINKAYPVNQRLRGLARNARRNQTPQEKKLWYDYLNKIKPRFHRQGIIDNFIVDFYCPKLRVVIEIDGFQHYFKDAWEYDKERTAKLENIGFSVLRFDNEDVNIRMDYVIRAIQEFCENRANELKLTDCDFSLH